METKSVRLLTVTQYAEEFGISPRAILRLMAEGRARTIRLRGTIRLVVDVPDN